MPRKLTLTFAAAAVAGLALTTAACAPNDAPASAPASAAAQGGTAAITVSSTADACTLSATQARSGNVVFKVTNDGDDVTEFYLLAADGRRVIAEVEDIGPGLSRDLAVTAKPGSYLTACKPGMVGDGIRAKFTVTGA